MSVCQSRLFQDLHSGRRDATYRGFAYVHNCGGPDTSDGTSIEELHGRCDEVLGWLLRQDELAGILDGYAAFVERWSPVFED